MASEQWYLTSFANSDNSFDEFIPVYDKMREMDMSQLGLPFIYVKARSPQIALAKLINHILDLYREEMDALKDVGFGLARDHWENKPINYQCRCHTINIMRIGTKDIRQGGVWEYRVPRRPLEPIVVK